MLGFANIYYAIGRRALDLAADSARQRTSVALTRSIHPEVQHCISEMAMEVEALGPYIDRIADDWSMGADHTQPSAGGA